MMSLLERFSFCHVALMKALQPDCLGFYVPVKAFVAEHYHPPFVAELSLQVLNGYGEFAAEHFQVNEGRRGTRSVNSGMTSPRTTHCHSLPDLTLQLRGISLSPVN